MKRWRPYIILIVLFIFLFTGHVEAQCSQCKLLAMQNGYEKTIDGKILDKTNGNTINSAILYIMAAPYILGGIFLFRFRKKIKKFVSGFGGQAGNQKEED